MTIKELIEKLAKLPQEAEVLFYNKQDDDSYSVSFIDNTYANDGYYSRIYLEQEIEE